MRDKKESFKRTLAEKNRGKVSESVRQSKLETTLLKKQQKLRKINYYRLKRSFRMKNVNLLMLSA